MSLLRARSRRFYGLTRASALLAERVAAWAALALSAAAVTGAFPVAAAVLLAAAAVVGALTARWVWCCVDAACGNFGQQSWRAITDRPWLIRALPSWCGAAGYGTVVFVVADALGDRYGPSAYVGTVAVAMGLTAPMLFLALFELLRAPSRLRVLQTYLQVMLPVSFAVAARHYAHAHRLSAGQVHTLVTGTFVQAATLGAVFMLVGWALRALTAIRAY